MLSNFDRAIPLILSTEGGFVNDPDDPGGATNLGVTIHTAKALGLDVDHDGDVDVVDIKLLKPADAAKVYKRFYWDALQGDLLPSGLDYALVDFGVNSGVAKAARTIQQIVGVNADGVIGMKTLAAVGRLNVQSLIERVSDQRLRYLIGLHTWAKFGKGWKARVERVKAQALAWAK